MKTDVPLFSIIVPVYREAENINSFLEHLNKLQGSSRAEVIVVDGGPGDTLGAIKHADQLLYRLVPLCSPRGRGIQLNYGAALAKAKVLVFLHIDVRLPICALTLIEESLKRFDAGAFAMRVCSANILIRLIGLTASLRSRLTRVPYGDQGFFVKRSVYFGVGGYDCFPIMEDVAIMRKFKIRSIRIRILKPPVITSERRWRTEGVLRTTLRNWHIYLLYRWGVSPWKLERSYRAINARARF